MAGKKDENPAPNLAQGQVSRDPTQLERFQRLARDLAADEDEARFEETVKKVAKSPPVPAEKPE